MEDPKLIDKWFSQLPPHLRYAAGALIRLADDSGIPLYLVGGPVRDLLLGRPSLDLDFVVKGDATAVAQHLGTHLRVRPILHPTFFTASLRLDKATLDLTTARAETYRRPGALPTVRPSHIDDDLARRDFTINAMALCLTTPRRGALLDPFAGRSDLRRRLIRALHPSSFVDDPTRALRAARYAARLGFCLEDQTLRHLRSALPHLEAVSPARIHQEVARILREDTPEQALLLLQEWGVLSAIHPTLSFDGPRATAFAELRSLNPTAAPAAYWPLLAWNSDESSVAVIIRRMGLTKSQAQSVTMAPRVRWLQHGLFWSALRPSEIVAALSPYPLATLWAFAVTAQGLARQRTLEYLQHLRHVRPALRGGDLQVLGVPPGPITGEVLRRLKVAKLDGVVTTRKEEEKFVLSLKPQTHTGAS